MSTAGMSQKEYLKKYLSIGNDDKKKKKKRKHTKPPVNRLRIVDDDIDISTMRPLGDDELELYDLHEDAPQIAGIVDERPEEVKIKERFGSKKWKVVADENDAGVKVIDNANVKSENVNRDEDSDHSPIRKIGNASDPLCITIKEGPTETVRMKSNVLSKVSEITCENSELSRSPLFRSHRNSDSDASPHRKRNKICDSSKENNENCNSSQKDSNSNSDQSPARKSKLKSNSSKSLQEKERENSNFRKEVRKDISSKYSKKRGKYSDSDESPVRKHEDSDNANDTNRREKIRKRDDRVYSRRNKKDSDDESPKKKDWKRNDSDESPRRDLRYADETRKTKRFDTDKKDLRNEDKKDGRKYSPVQKERRKENSTYSPRIERRSRADSSDTSPVRRIRKGDSDCSPPRKDNKNYNAEKLSKIRDKKEDDSDTSPARKGQRKDERRNDSENRRRERGDTSDMSPVRKGRKDDSDTSLPLREKKYYKKREKNDSDESPVRKEQRREDNIPYSWKERKDYCQVRFSERKERRDDRYIPDRNRRYENSDDYLSRKCGRNGDMDLYPRGGKRQRDLEYRDLSRNYRGRDNEETRNLKKRSRDYKHNSPVNETHHDDFKSKDSYRKGESELQNKSGTECDSSKKPRVEGKKTMDGRKAGLVDATELRAEIADLQNREKEMFEKMDVNVSGRGAAPIMRNRRTGKRRDLEQEALEKEEKDEKEAERNSKYTRWGKGLKQVDDHNQKLKEDLYEMSKPLARYADDEDLDKFLRDQEREGDPMLEYVRNKSTQEDTKEGKLQYTGSFMPNRFGIRPGYRWDGVDRSNGYEKQWFEQRNAKKAVEEEAYKWSTADM